MDTYIEDDIPSDEDLVEYNVNDIVFKKIIDDNKSINMDLVQVEKTIKRTKNNKKNKKNKTEIIWDITNDTTRKFNPRLPVPYPK